MRLTKITEITVDNNLRETISHGTVEFPMDLYLDDFDLYLRGMVNWHWHSDIQITVMLKGQVSVETGKTNIILKEGEGVLFNSNVLHQMRPLSENGDLAFSIIFDPIIIKGGYNTDIAKKYVIPFTENSGIDVIILHPDVEWEKRILDIFYDIKDEYNRAGFGHELKMRNDLCVFWYELISNVKKPETANRTIKERDQDRIKKAMGFIGEHYSENISLDDIATYLNVCKSECCRCFKRYLNMTPFEFLMRHRISVAAGILAQGGKSVQEVALETGFNSPGYFTQLFKKYIGQSPREFRKKR